MQGAHYIGGILRWSHIAIVAIAYIGGIYNMEEAYCIWRLHAYNIQRRHVTNGGGILHV